MTEEDVLLRMTLVIMKLGLLNFAKASYMTGMNTLLVWREPLLKKMMGRFVVSALKVLDLLSDHSPSNQPATAGFLLPPSRRSPLPH
ncbi:hypothetical protein [Morganella morganii]|uniref:hypothetical protein n=1 Tax=Morganella morganii TaxID=582 RepID=UPI001646BD86|nr:hypothetical protein [Morganella morganii]MBC4002268.1 hypothetical protein [Morganella morganii]